MTKFVAWQVVSLMKNEPQSQNLLLKVDPRSTFRNKFLDHQLIMYGEKRETSIKTCNEIMFRDKLRVFIPRISPPLELLETVRYVNYSQFDWNFLGISFIYT